MSMPTEERVSQSLRQFSKVVTHLSRHESLPGFDAAFEGFWEAAQKSTLANPWFTLESIQKALVSLAYMLRDDALEKWMESYPVATEPKRVGIILAGNIPMVGFHDLLSVLAAGHVPVVKPSSQDPYLLPSIFRLIESVTPWKNDMDWVSGRLPSTDAVIATGSNNTARYFEYYFGKKPHIIRKNRSSVAILTGEETDEELQKLGTDIFDYFGLGCRNVSKLYIHDAFDINRFFKAIFDHNEIINHHKYANNYDYYRALWLMNREDLLENGFLVLRPSEAISSPVASLFYERFSDPQKLRKTLNDREGEIQCIVSKADVPFGKSQEPELWDYADGIDTRRFLEGI